MPGDFYGGAWWAIVHGVAKSWTELQSTEHIALRMGFPGSAMVKNSPANAGDARDAGLILGQEDLMEKEMETHSSILDWKIPRTEEPGQLQSMGSQTQTQWRTSMIA